ncbi:MAG: nicotinate-nucleotide diphosphorylase (carboxylating), partial [Cellvibrionales bacterium]|nr:nicotinate-nucleotide diphosphorylase (carboxylating) [Cellvibrionales bacterium]
SLDEFQHALDAKADIIMLDNFDNADKRTAVDLRNTQQPQIKIEASGGINDSTLVQVAETGVDYISIGSLTKDIKAVDLSMRLIEG